MKKYKSLKPYLLLWGTQSLSSLGSAMTVALPAERLCVGDSDALYLLLRALCACEHFCRGA